MGRESEPVSVLVADYTFRDNKNISMVKTRAKSTDNEKDCDVNLRNSKRELLIK